VARILAEALTREKKDRENGGKQTDERKNLSKWIRNIKSMQKKDMCCDKNSARRANVVLEGDAC
jgi:hypothetical protein